MKGTIPWIASVFVVTVAAAKAQGVPDSPGVEPLLILRVANIAHTRDLVLTRAEHYVSEIYGKAGIQILWLSGDRVPQPSNRSGLQLTVTVLPESGAQKVRPLNDGALGFALGHNGEEPRRAYVVADRVQQFSQKLAKNSTLSPFDTE